MATPAASSRSRTWGGRAGRAIASGVSSAAARCSSSAQLQAAAACRRANGWAARREAQGATHRIGSSKVFGRTCRCTLLNGGSHLLLAQPRPALGNSSGQAEVCLFSGTQLGCSCGRLVKYLLRAPRQMSRHTRSLPPSTHPSPRHPPRQCQRSQLRKHRRRLLRPQAKQVQHSLQCCVVRCQRLQPPGGLLALQQGGRGRGGAVLGSASGGEHCAPAAGVPRSFPGLARHQPQHT